MNTIDEKDADQLNAFLQGELAAVETYRQCIEKIDDPLVAAQLRQLLDSHHQRTRMLTRKIVALGGTPATTSGAWGAFTKLLERGATLFGDASAVSTLEQGEDHGRSLYFRELNELSPPTRAFVEQVIIPEQRRTHDALSALQRRL